MYWFSSWALLVAALSCLPSFAAGQVSASPARHYYIPTVPSDPQSVDFFLLTGGVGNEVNDRFGHVGLRVVNPEDGTDVVFNWGTFSFDDPGFLWKFYRGQLTYSMGVRTYATDLARYDAMHRRETMARLHLTPTQKRQLLEIIAYNAIPEHRSFSYQYWYKNCSTIPRDYLDQVLGGAIRKRYAGVRSDRVFRDYVRQNLARIPFVAPGLDILMNSRIDQPITQWDEMFLPAKLQEYLAALPAVDDLGREIQGQKLLEPATEVLSHPEEFQPAFNDYLALILPTALALFVALWPKVRAGSGFFYRCLGIGSVYWGLLSGAFGTALLANWVLSGHADGWHNANLFLFWPIDWVLVPIGMALLGRRQALEDRVPFAHAGRLYAAIHILALAALVLLVSTGAIEQNVWRVACWFGPVMTLLCATLLAKGWQSRTVAASSPKSSLATKVGSAETA